MDTVKSSDATEIIDTPSSGMITPTTPPSSEVQDWLHKWVIRMQAALAILPPPEKEALRMAFWAGLQCEVASFVTVILYHTFTEDLLQVQITSMIGTAFLKDMQLTIPPLIKKAAAVMDEFHSLPQLIVALDELRAIAFPQGLPPPEIHQDRWVEEWWNNLDSATFPAANYLLHRDRQRRLIERLQAVRDLTEQALNLNMLHMDGRAHELNQITDGAERIANLAMPNHAARDEMMEEGIARESSA